MITRISRLRDYGIFRDFTWPENLPTFGRYNLIYGWNGSGKTLLSGLFRRLENKSPITNCSVTVSIDDRDTHGDSFDQTTVPIRVFNREFIAESVFTKTDEVAPIYVIGPPNVEKQKQVVELINELEILESKLLQLKDKRPATEKQLEDFCISRAKIIKDTIGGSGNPYSNYNKTDFRSTADSLKNKAGVDKYKLDEETRRKLLAQHRASPKPKVGEIEYKFPDIIELFEEVRALLARTVVSSAIDSLKDDPRVAAWAREGLGFHRERNLQNCLFCTNKLPPNRLKELEAHFSNEYERLLKDIENMLERISELSRVAEKFSAPNKAELYDDIAAEYDEILAACRRELDKTITALNVLARSLEVKKEALFESLSTDEEAPKISSMVVEDTNVVLRKHNESCDKFQSRAIKARDQLEKGYVVEALDEYFILVKAEADVKDTDELMQGEKQNMKKKITQLEREIVGHREPADELNRDLQEYLGHNEIFLQVKATGYQITRNGQMAKGLSEGEQTAIALLYFLKSLRDRSFNLNRGIVVLDDPVSSLDANALFCAFGLIRARTQSAAQLFILTHNFTFFSQVRNWFQHLKRQKRKKIVDRPARFYMLDCKRIGTKRRASIRWIDPLLERYQSEYHYLFSTVYRVANASPTESLEEYYYLPNAARRLLESFLAFRRPKATGDLWDQLKEINFDESKKNRIIRFLHTYSHYGQVGEPEHDPSALSEAPSVLKEVIELIQTEDLAHYSAMELLVAEADNTESEQ